MRLFYTAALMLALAAPVLAQDADQSWIQTAIANVDAAFSSIVSAMSTVLFAKLGTGVPLIIWVLVLGGIYYSFYFGWISLRGFRHSIDVIRGRYDDPNDPGEISHFQALTSALSATIGLGNIAGVAIAVSLGGPGAVFWMLLTALFGMSSKLASCTLAVMYRKIHPDGRISGGPMYYLEHGLAGKGLKSLGRVFAILFAIFAIGGALGGGNMFQVNQTIEILSTVSPAVEDYNWAFGILFALLVSLVIIGGIKRIGSVTSRIVPFMCLLYVSFSLLIILSNITQVPAMIATIFREAFSPQAMYGGFLAVLIMGVRRAAFSNEAGLGSAAFAHAAARTNEPAREGMVAMIGPFIDTIVICLMTALVCMITGVYTEPQFQSSDSIVGARMTAAAFDSFLPGARYVLAIGVMLFAYSTMISWSYYGERAWEYLFGNRVVLIYRIIFVFFVFLGSIITLRNVLNFTDMLILSMAFPNIIGGIILSPQIKACLQDYWGRLKSGEMKRYK